MKDFFRNHKKTVLFHIILLICFSAYLLSADFLFDRVIMVNGESTLQEITLPDETRDINSNVEVFYNNRLDWKDVILLSGFAFIQEESMDGRKIYLVLRSNSSEYVFDTITSAREDITHYFYNGTFDLRNSGWRANIPDSFIGDEDFQIGYLIGNSTQFIGNTTTPSFTMSHQYVNKTGFYWK